jgi:hypothetical protein
VWTAARFVRVGDRRLSGGRRLLFRAVVAWLHLMQPVARLAGRIDAGLTMWRTRGPGRRALPLPRTHPVLVTRWTPPEVRLRAIQQAAEACGAVVLHGGDYDRWDLEARGGLFGSARLLMATEDSGSGTQLVRVRTWPKYPGWVVTGVGILGAVAVPAVASGATGVALVVGAVAGVFVWRAVSESATATRALWEALVTCQVVPTGGVGRAERLAKAGQAPGR